MKNGMQKVEYLNEREIRVDGKIYTISKDNDIVEYKGMKFRKLGKEEDGVVLVLDNKLPKEMMEEIFNKKFLDSDGDVKFSASYDNYRWRDSIIRMVLNSKFLEKVDIDDLVEMETTIDFNGEKVTTRDYVRIPSKEEYESMDKEIRGMADPNGSVFKWSLSPYYMNSGGGASVFAVYSRGILRSSRVDCGGAVVPVIKLSTECYKRIINND